jgi:hypothetical protein
MTQQTRFPMSEVTGLQNQLENMPEPPPRDLSRREAIVALTPQIRALQAKGYTFAAIAALLTERGLPVTEAMLKKSLARPASGRKRLRRATRSTANGAPGTAPGEATGAAPTAHPTATETSTGTTAVPATVAPPSMAGDVSAGDAPKAVAVPRPSGAESSTAAAPTTGPLRPTPATQWTPSISVGDTPLAEPGGVGSGAGTKNATAKGKP